MGTQPKRKKQRSSWGKDPSVPGRPYSFDSMNWGGRDSRYTRIMLFSSMMFAQLFFKLLLLLLFGIDQHFGGNKSYEMNRARRDFDTDIASCYSDWQFRRTSCRFGGGVKQSVVSTQWREAKSVKIKVFD